MGSVDFSGGFRQAWARDLGLSVLARKLEQSIQL